MCHGLERVLRANLGLTRGFTDSRETVNQEQSRKWDAGVRQGGRP